MKIKQYNIYLADLEPSYGTEPGKIRPVVVVQANLLNESNHSTMVCPITAKVIAGFKFLRIHLPKKESGLKKDSDVLVDQIRAIDNRRFIKKIAKLTLKHQNQLAENLKIILFE
jgi:mRNA interferase MazF